MRSNFFKASVLLASLAMATGCGGPPADDGGTDVTAGPDAAADARADVRDAAPDAAPQLFASCAGNAMCTATLGSRATCLTAFPGGICTKPCTSDTACGASGVCLQQICFPRCTPGAGECNQFGSACAAGANSAMDPSFGACVPSCFGTGLTAPTGYPMCAAPAMCDSYNGTCTAMAATGADNGAACAADSDCMGGQCITEVGTSGPTGFLGGYCISFGRMPDPALYAVGQPLPRGNCPTGSVALPAQGSQGEGDSAVCLKGCSANGDCRTGYTCNKESNRPNMPFSTGICLPVNCAMAAMACPTGYMCQIVTTDAGVQDGTCIPATATDGGTDAATDAATDGTTG